MTDSTIIFTMPVNFFLLAIKEAEMLNKKMDSSKKNTQNIPDDKCLRQELITMAESEKNLKAYLDSFPHALSEIDIYGTIKFSNVSHHHILEYEPNELTGISIIDFMETDSEKKDLINYLDLVQREQPEPSPWRGKNRTKNGKIIDVKVDWSYIRNPKGKIIGYSSIITDITSELKATRALQESENKYRNLIENSIEGIAVYDNKKIHFANRALLDMFGYESLEEFISIPVLNHLTEESQKSFKTKRKNGSLIKTPPGRYYYEIIRKDGTIRTLEVAPAEINCDGQKLTQSTFIDITEAKEAIKTLNIMDEMAMNVRRRFLHKFLQASLKLVFIFMLIYRFIF